MVYVPLMEALEDGAPMDTIRSILDEAPVEEIRGQQLFVAVNHAIEEMSEPEILRLLIEQDTSCAFMKQEGGENFLLHSACYWCNRELYDTVLLLLELNPQAIREKDKSGDLPLHYLLYEQIESTLQTVELLVKHYPDSIRVANSGGKLPIHVACRKEGRLEVVQFLESQYPDGLRTGDVDNRLPLHSLAFSGGTLTEVFEFLMGRYPQAVSARTKDGSLPLHLACQQNNWEMAQLLLAANPAGARAADSEGFLAIHCALCGPPPVDFVRSLIDAYPESVHFRTSSGKLPLHNACLGRASSETVQLLLELYPDAVHVADNQGWLPLHCACGYRCSPSVENCRLLIQADPLTILRKSNSQKTPLELAFQSGHAAETKAYLLEQQEIVVRAHRDAVEFVVSGCLDVVDDNRNYPDLAIDCIWRFARPDVWYPPGSDDDTGSLVTSPNDDD